MSKQILRIAIVSTLATLAACATSPEFKRPAAPAVERYSESAGESAQLNGQTTQQQIDFGSQLPAQWWRLFQSQELNGIVERALANNQTLVAAQASVKQAQALTEAKTGERYPEIDMTASSGRQKYGQQFLGPLAASAPPFTYYAFGPNVSYTLDYAGGISHAVEEQRALTEYQARQLQAAQLSVTGNVVLQALEVAARQAEISALEELLADDRRNLEMIEAAFTAGSVSRVDVLSAQSQLASDTTQLPQLRQQLSVARHALAALSGDTPTNAIIPAFQLSAFVLPEKLPVSLPSELVHQRPDILSAESQLHAATAAVGVATANLYPRITLTGSFSQQALKAGDLFNAANSAWGVIGSLTAPIFDGGRLRAERRAALAALTVQAARYQQVVLDSFAQVADALDAIGHNAEQEAAQSQALTVARQSLELTRASYEEGNVGVLQVLDSERLYQQARLGYVRAQAQRLQDTARLFVALGGSTTVEATASLQAASASASAGKSK